MEACELVEALARTRIGMTYNQYARSEVRRQRLRAYLEERADASWLLVGEAAGYRGARVSGLAFTSERQLTGAGPAEATATVVHRALEELGLEAEVLLWNVVPTHPGTEGTNRRPSRGEVDAGRPFLDAVAQGRRVLAVGRLAASVTGAPYLRHPAARARSATGSRRRLPEPAGPLSGALSPVEPGACAATIRRRRTRVRRVHA